MLKPLAVLTGGDVKASRFKTTSPSPLWGSNPKRGTCSCQLLTEGCWFNLRNNVFLQLWKLTAKNNQIHLRLKNGVNINSPHITSPHQVNVKRFILKHQCTPNHITLLLVYLVKCYNMLRWCIQWLRRHFSTHHFKSLYSHLYRA